MTESWLKNGVCRCCHFEGVFTSLEEIFKTEPVDITLSSLIRETFDVDITSVSGEFGTKLNTICDDCIPRLWDAAMFRKQILACEKKFNDFINNHTDSDMEMKQENKEETWIIGDEEDKTEDKYSDDVHFIHDINEDDDDDDDDDDEKSESKYDDGILQLADNQLVPRRIGLRPDFVPFKNVKDVEKFQNMDENAYHQLINYLSNYRGGDPISANLRFILSKNRLFTEEFVSKLVYVQAKEGKFAIGRTRIDHALYNYLKEMYPQLTIFLYQKAMQQALKAASARVKARETSRKKKKSNGGRNKRNVVQQEFYDEPYGGDTKGSEGC